MKAKHAKHPGEVVLELNRRDEPLWDAANQLRKPSPFRIKRILVPTDFSDCSKKALAYAIPLAREYEAAITLLHVVPINYSAGEYGGGTFIDTEMRANGLRELDRLAAAEIRENVTFQNEVRVGSPTTEIIDLAKSLPADIIVLSTHGHTGLKHALLGSVAEHVVRRAPCPVLVVREKEHDFVEE
ncbi:MAG: universal stress protein [Verrucomicrobia bacterium]|nr:universal stress protein [Verrucomicrobiota bacterium]